MRGTAVVLAAIAAVATSATIAARAWHRNPEPTTTAVTEGEVASTLPVDRKPRQSNYTSMNFVASSVRAPRYQEAMTKLREAEAAGRLDDLPSPDAPAEELRTFGKRWHEEWGPSFEVIVENSRPLLPVGSPAPDWQVTDLDGGSVEVEEFRGKHILLIFGSLSCPTTCFKVSQFESLANKFADAGLVSIFVYEREAHPDSQFGFGVVPQAFSLEDRSMHARRLAAMFGLTQRIVIDDMNNSTKKAYAAQDNSAYLIDRDGRIVLSQVFFDSDEIDRELAAAIGSLGMDIK